MSSERRIWLLLLGALALLYAVRRLYLLSWLHTPSARSANHAVVPRAGVIGPGPGARAGPVRVVLIDGLGRDVADNLPTLARLCAAGKRLTVDVGFPSISLPVQHALWSGVWQTESGVQFAERLDAPRRPTLPQAVSSTAVADAYGEIARSLGFGRVIAPPWGQRFSSPETERLALAAVRGGDALVLVHLLDVDRVGHRDGAASTAYRNAALEADGLVDRLHRALPPRALLIVLSDHGHLAQGGHGDAEPEVRQVRTCLTGDPARVATLARHLPARTTLVALHDLVAAALGVRVRPPTRALDQVLPLPGLAQRLPLMLVAALLAMGCLALALRRSLLTLVALLPWGSLIGVALAALLWGLPSLSQPYAYRAIPYPLWPAGCVAALVALVQWSWLRRQFSGARAGLLLVASCAAGGLWLAGLTGFPGHLPPLVPFVSGWASTLLGLALYQALALALVSLPLSVGRGARRSRATSRRGRRAMQQMASLSLPDR